MKNNIKPNGQTNIYEWYKENYPNDEWAIQVLNRNINFQDVFECLAIGYDIYKLLGSGDSLVREKVFATLASIMECSYEHIYYQWINGGKMPLGGRIVEDMTNLRF